MLQLEHLAKKAKGKVEFAIDDNFKITDEDFLPLQMN